MIFERNSKYEGKHAIISPSQYGWIKNHDEEALVRRIKAYYASQMGTALHELARKLIEDGIKLNRYSKSLILFYLLEKKIPRSVIDMDIWCDAFITFVNDAIALDMTPEVQLIYSSKAFGTTDAISFDGNILRIHDLKTGILTAKMDQLMAYAAFFCLQYNVNPKDIQIELRIYQSDNILTMNPSYEEMAELIEIVKESDRFVNGYLGKEE